LDPQFLTETLVLLGDSLQPHSYGHFSRKWVLRESVALLASKAGLAPKGSR
jgi:hypothetical protein